MKAFPRIILGLLCAGFAASVQAERLPVRTFTSADGLGSSFVSYLMRDSRGFLWVCTRDGLSRFDGSRFVTYQVGDSNAPPGIEQILETRKGIYWIVTTGGLYRFDPLGPSVNRSTNTERPALNVEFAGNDRWFLFEDREGNLWSGGDGLYRSEEKNHRLEKTKVELNLPVKSAVGFALFDMIESRDGSLWMLTTWGLLKRLPDGRETLYTIEARRISFLTSILEDSEGRIWVGCHDGVFVIKPELIDENSAKGMVIVRKLAPSAKQESASGQVSLPQRPGEIINIGEPIIAVDGHQKLLYQTGDKHIWISDANRLVEFEGDTFRIHTSAEGLINDSAQMIEDGNGNLWLGNPTALVRLQRGGLTSYGADDGIKGSYVITINQTLDGKLYLMGPDFGLSMFEQNAFETIRPRLPPVSSAVWTANSGFQDSAGEWWFLTKGKLYRFAATKDFRVLARNPPRVAYDTHDGLKGDDMFHIFEDSRRDLWISTFPTGLSRWSRATENFHTFTEAEGFPSDKSAASFAEDRNGNLWLGFYEGGLTRYAGDRFTQFTSADGAPNGFITALYIDQRGRLWAGSSQGGVSRIDDPGAPRPRFVTYTTDHGLASNNVRSITGDLFGNIYLGTARGVDRISPDAKLIKHYSIGDGLAGDFVTSAFRDRSGALWFGTPNGVSRLVPAGEKAASAPPVLISGLRIAGERRPVSELGAAEIPAIEMSHSQNNLQIDFFGIDFSAGESLRYQYKLEGADADWSSPTLQRAVTYANIAPGSYRFLVRAVSPSGLISENPASFSFKILPPIWQRWWFVTLMLLALVGTFYLLYRYRLAQLLKVERVRTRIATDLHDDIGASLSRVAILSEVVKQQTASNGGQAAPLLTEIADSARGLVDSMSDIVWSIDPRRDDLQSVVRRIRQFASDVLEAKAIDWQLHVPPEVESLKLGPEERQHLFLIFKEGINNVARHGDGAKSVSLSIKLEGRQLIGQINDDGCGFTPREPDEARSKGRGGNGLPNMRARAAQLGGRLEIASSPGAGTRLTLQMPIK